jgi:L-asparaginase
LIQSSPFVVTHGTDRVFETAIYLETRLPELRVPIVLAGAMRPLGFQNSDGLFDIYRAKKDLERGAFIEVGSE